MMNIETLENLKSELLNEIMDVDDIVDNIIIAFGESDEIITNVHNDFIIAYENKEYSQEYIIEFDYLNDYEIQVVNVDEYK